MPPSIVMPVLFVDMAKKVLKDWKDYEFWHWLCRARPPAAANVARLKDEDKICAIIKSNKAAFIEQTQKKPPTGGKAQSKGKNDGGKGHGNVTSGRAGSTPKRPGVDGKAKSHQQMLEIEALMHMPCMNAFKYEDGSSAQRIAHGDHDRDSRGIMVGMINTHAKEILEMGGEHTVNPQAYVLFGKDVPLFVEEKAFHLYKTQIIKVPTAKKKGEKISDEYALLVNVGATDILYNSFIAKVTAPTSAYVTLSYRIYKDLNDPKVFAGTAKKEGFMNHVNTTLKADWIYTQVPSVPTSCTKTTKINDDESAVQFGYLNVKRDKLNEVLKRSGHNGAIIWFQHHDDTTSLVELPRKIKHKEAMEINKRVGDVSLGLINKNCGRWCIRVPKDEAIVKDVKAKIDPAVTTVVGPLLMNMPDSMGCRYVLKGLVSQMTYAEVAKMIKEDFQWNIRPEKFIKSKTSNYNNMIVFAAAPPSQRLLQYNGTSNFIEIEDFIVRKPNSKVIDKIFEEYSNKREQACENATQVEPDDSQEADSMFQKHVRECDFGSQSGSQDDGNYGMNEVDMTADWFDAPIDEPDNSPAINLATGANASNIWQTRKSNAIKEATAHAEDKAAKIFWQERKKEADITKTANDKDIEKFKEAIVTDTAKEFQRLKEQLLQQNLENDKKIKDMMDSQRQIKEQFDHVRKTIDEKLDGRLNDFFGTINTAINAQAQTFGIAIDATNGQLNDLQVEFGSLKAKLVDFMDNFGKKPAEKRDADVNDDPPAKQSRGSTA